MSDQARLRLLYVEDSALDAEVTVSILARLDTGFLVTVAPSIAAAKEHLDAQHFDLLLTDYYLPDGDGLMLLSYVRQLGMPTAVVLITGDGNEELVIAALKAGADDYLPKRPEYLKRLPAILTGAYRRCQSRSAARAEPLRVLYSDANAATAEQTRVYLARHAPHMLLDILPSGLACLERLDEQPYDVALIAYELSDMSGLALLKEINERGMGLPALLIAAPGNEELAAAALRLGAADYVVQHEGYLFRLVPTIEHVIARFRLEQEQRALRASEERFRSLFERIHDALFICDDNGRCEEVNAAACELTGRPRDELRHCLLADLVPTSDVEMLRQDWRAFRQTGQWDGELMVCQPDGTLRPADLSAVAEFRPGQHLVALRDLTQRKQAEKQLRDSQIQLIHAEKLAALGQLISGVAHELNNPLAGIIGYAQLLSELDIPDDIRSDVAMIEAQANRAKRIIGNLLIFARRRTPERSWSDVNELIERTLDLRSYEMQAHGVLITLRLTRGLPLIIADPYQLQQVLLNLILNAEQALSEPSWHAVAKEAPRLTITTSLEYPQSEGGRCELVIRIGDNGPGIPPAIQRRIFEPFFTTKPVGVGTGLGLAIAYGIVRDHEGRIWVESSQVGGTTMAVALPVQAREPGSVTHGEEITMADEQRRRILVIDDEATITSVLQRMLTHMGMHADIASTGNDALRILREQHYDGLLCDLRLTDMTAQQFYEQLLKERPALERKVIFMTGAMTSETAVRFLRQSGCTCLIKPFEMERVLRVINEVLGPR